MLQTIEQEDYDFLWDTHYKCVREGFIKENIKARQIDWNRKAYICAAVTAGLFAILFTYHILK